jgi:hypothetical protein
VQDGGSYAANGLTRPRLYCSLMPPVLHRLLASPSAWRLLRFAFGGPELPATCSTAAKCYISINSRPAIVANRQTPTTKKWKRWHEVTDSIARRERVRQMLEADGTAAAFQVELEHLEGDTSVLDGAEDSAAQWATTLAQRERLHGERGINIVWSARRHAGYALPTHDLPHAGFLWATFIKHPKLVTQVVDHAAELWNGTGQTYPRLYEVVMSYWLPRDTTAALGYHQYMLEKLELKTLPLKQLARLGQLSFTLAAYTALMEIYKSSDNQDLYDDIVMPLLVKGDVSMARRWHHLCTLRGDMPSDSVATHPAVRIFTSEAMAKSNPAFHFMTHSTGQKLGKEIHKYDQDLMRRLLGRDSAPVRFDDSFCAKMFATRTFSPESVIQGLAMVGVNEIGPQAVLAMALRTEPLDNLPKRFEQLRATGIALQGCVYSLAIEKFAMEHKWQLVRSMLDSDQHPDVFGDTDVQRKLLNHYLDQQDELQAQRTLAVLTIFHNDSSKESWNLLLETHISRTGAQYVTEVLQDMRTQSVMVDPRLIPALCSLLRKRQPGHKPVTQHRREFDDLRFVTRTLVFILESGMGSVAPLSWREIVRRFGMTGRFRELRRLLLWLLCWYAPRSDTQFSDLPKSPFLDTATTKLRNANWEQASYFNFPTTVTQEEKDTHPVPLLFPPSLQQALIIWGFRARLLPNANLEQSLLGHTLEKKHYRRRLLERQVLKRKQWNIGLKTVVLLRKLGVHVSHRTVVKALQMQFVVLFGRRRSNIVENRVMEKSNTIPYATYVREVNEIWGSPLFCEPQLFGKGMVHNHMWHPRMRRRVDRKAEISLKEMMGSERWKQARMMAEEEQSATKIEEHGNDAVVDELKDRFVAQGRSLDPDFDFLAEPGYESVNTGPV